MLISRSSEPSPSVEGLDKPRPCAQRRGRHKILITMGDPSGIGAEIALKSLASRRIQRLAKFFLIIGDFFVLNKVKDLLRIKVSLNVVNKITDAKKFTINIYDLKNVSGKRFKFGEVRKSHGLASIEYLNKSLSIINGNKDIGLVTAPINKEAINKANFRYTGHTEFLSEATKSYKIAMMLIGEPLRVTLLTRHLPLREVSNYIKQKDIIDAIELTHNFLRKYLDKREPKIAVASLNPHGGEGGVLGNEEKKIIEPSIIKASRRYPNIYGPVAPDVIFHDAYRGEVDGIICMYHDQGLIPLKMIARDRGVNITLGLPFIRTSPAHGTAFDIAGKGIANPFSMMEAIKVAAQLLS